MGLDRMTVESTLTSDLPVQARWMIDGTPLGFEFTVGRLGLRRLPDEVLEAGDTASSELLVFGEQDFAEGGGARPWLCVRECEGAVCGSSTSTWRRTSRCRRIVRVGSGPSTPARTRTRIGGCSWSVFAAPAKPEGAA
jgi:hypothetical protein